jgi:hypothetical protein
MTKTANHSNMLMSETRMPSQNVDNRQIAAAALKQRRYIGHLVRSGRVNSIPIVYLMHPLCQWSRTRGIYARLIVLQAAEHVTHRGEAEYRAMEGADLIEQKLPASR